MQPMTPEASDGAIDTEAIAAVLRQYPVAVGFLFGSQARGTAGEASDIDIAVAFEALEPGDAEYNETLFGLSADLAVALGTDDVDVVDIRHAPPTLARAIFEEGQRLVGTTDDARQLRAQVRADTDNEERSSPKDRFDDILAAIDDHLA